MNKYEGSNVESIDDYTKKEQDLIELKSEIGKKIINHIIKLANPVTESTSLAELKKIRLSNPLEFSTPEVICRIFYILSKYKYSRKTRIILHTLFQDLSHFDMDFNYLDKEYSKNFI